MRANSHLTITVKDILKARRNQVKKDTMVYIMKNGGYLYGIPNYEITKWIEKCRNRYDSSPFTAR